MTPISLTLTGKAHHFLAQLTAFLAESPRLSIWLASILIILCGLVYLPGISGPFVFDDATNLLGNSYVQISELSIKSLYRAAYSLEAGPLHRPIAMISFALNYYFAGSFDNAAPFKLTNIVIHVGNGLLIFWLLRLIFTRLAYVEPQTNISIQLYQDKTKVNLLSAAIAMLWLAHPIQVTSVLYVVQRMESLAALFTLLGLICYLQGRMRMVSGQNGGKWLVLLGVTGFGVLGILTKENAALLLLFMVALELVAFRNETPWTQWRTLSRTKQFIIVSSVLLFVTVAFISLILYALPGYAIRNFTMPERLLTEARVLIFYLSLILVPRIDQFAIYHDDIAISTSLLTPWSTLPSLIIIVALLITAVMALKKYPLLSLGLLWFFTGHAIESTFLGLEIAHEHRNYLASLGVWLVLAFLIIQLRYKFEIKKSWVILPILIISFSAITVLRSNQWSDFNGLAQYEAAHHPDSADAYNFLGVNLARQHQFIASYEAFRQASRIAPSEPLYLINTHFAAMLAGIKLDTKDRELAVKTIAEHQYAPSVYNALENISTCLQNQCSYLQPIILDWTKYLIKRAPDSHLRSFYYYLRGLALAGQGRYTEAIAAQEHSRQDDTMYLHPLIAICQIYIQRGNIAGAERSLAELRLANQGNLHPRDKEIGLLAEQLDVLKSSRKASRKPESSFANLPESAHRVAKQ